MYINAKSLNGFEVRSNGDSLGGLTDLFFDDKSWKIRYIVVDTGSWLVGRRVLLSGDAIAEIDSRSRVLRVTATKQQVEDSPGIDLLRPLSPRDLEEIHKHYGWPAFQVFPVLAPMVPLGFLTPPSPYTTPDTEISCADATANVENGDEAQYCFTKEASAFAKANSVHLRSTNEVEGYHILAQDGSLGHAQDFLIDESDWTIRYVVVDTKNWIPGRVVLVPTSLVAAVDWQDSSVRVNLSREHVKTAPEYNHSAPFSPELEQKLKEHYGQA